MQIHNNLIKTTSTVVLAIAIGAALTACNDDDVADAVGDGSPALLASDDSGSTTTELSALNAAPDPRRRRTAASAPRKKPVCCSCVRRKNWHVMFT